MVFVSLEFKSKFKWIEKTDWRLFPPRYRCFKLNSQDSQIANSKKNQTVTLTIQTQNSGLALRDTFNSSSTQLLQDKSVKFLSKNATID